MRLPLLSALALALCAADPAFAQSRVHVREGFTLSGGGGIGLGAESCDACSSSRETAPTMYVRAGGAVRRNLIIGGEFDAWSRSVTATGGKTTTTIATINAIAQWFPMPAGGFYLLGGVGMGIHRSKTRVASGFQPPSDESNGVGYQVGTGYDFLLGSNVSITPFANFFGVRPGESSVVGPSVGGSVLQIGVGLTLH